MKVSLPFPLQKGFGLIEVLITMLVLGVALLALAGFQGRLLQEGGYAKARTVALNLAQEKLEDLRSFEQLSPAGNETFAYAEIGTNTGGIIPSGEITLSEDNVTYNRTWEAEPYYYCPTAGDPHSSELIDENNCNRPYPDFNIVTMTVSWEDAEGPHSVQLENTIHGTEPAKNVRALASPPPNEKPYIGYTPGQRPEVIDFDLGDDTKKEATDPEPDVSRHEVSTVTRFDQVYYAASTLRTLRRDEFLTVNCTCEQLGASAGDQENGLSPAFFNGATYGLSKPIEGKRIGARATGGQLNAQPQICNICCRDHHDAGGYPLYDPFRYSIADDEDSSSECSQGGEYLAGGDHKHCYPDENGDLQPADAAGELYLEACRFVRVNGFLRVAQDWQLEALHVLPDDYLLTDAGVAAYTAYVKRFVEEYILSIGDNYPQERPNPANFSSTFQDLLDALPTSIPLSQGGEKQLLARGIYIDYMSMEEGPDEEGPGFLKLLQCKINPASHNDCPNTESEGFLDIAPFHEANLTRLANWSVAGKPVTVTDEPLENGKEETYSRGFITADEAGTSVVTAAIELSNTGLTDSRTIDPHDGLVRNASLEVTVSEASEFEEGIVISGTIAISGNVKDREPSHILVEGSNGAICTKPKDTEYHCALDDYGNGTITFSNYVTEAQNNKVEPKGDAWSTQSVINECLLDESTSYTFVGVSTDETMDIVIKKDGGGGCLS